MSDSQYCYVHWRDSDLTTIDTEWEAGELPDDDIMVPLVEQPVATDENEQAYFEQEMLKMGEKWTDQDLPTTTDS